MFPFMVFLVDQATEQRRYAGLGLPVRGDMDGMHVRMISHVHVREHAVA